MKLLNYIILTILLIITIKGALAISVDADDSVVVHEGQIVSQSLILYDFGDNLDAVELSTRNVFGDSTTSWFTLQNSSNFTETDDGYVFIDYKIQIPYDTPVGVYRAVFEFDDGEDTAYYNVKISVQNRFIAGFHRLIGKQVVGSITTGNLFISLILLLVVVYIVFQISGYGGFYGKKKK